MERSPERRPERRKERRVTLVGPAKLRVLDVRVLDVQVTPASWDVDILDVSGSGMRLRLPRPLACGTLVEIAAGDTLSLGEVCRCVLESPATPHMQTELQPTFSIGIQVQHTLTGLGELERFSRMLDEYGSAPRAVSVTYSTSVQE